MKIKYGYTVLQNEYVLISDHNSPRYFIALMNDFSGKPGHMRQLGSCFIASYMIISLLWNHDIRNQILYA